MQPHCDQVIDAAQQELRRDWRPHSIKLDVKFVVASFCSDLVRPWLLVPRTQQQLNTMGQQHALLGGRKQLY